MRLTLAVGVSDDKPALDTVESRAAAAAERVIGSDKFCFNPLPVTSAPLLVFP